MTQQIVRIEPGIYPSLSNREYHADPALSHSSMERLAITAAHFKVKAAATPAMALGAAIHCKVLQPELFSKDFIIWPTGHRRKKVEIETAKANGQEWIKEVDIITIDAMIESINNHPTAYCLLSGGEPEVSYIYRHAQLGFMCKSRPDYKYGTTLVDLKTCIDASPAGFAKAASNFGYIRQADWYMSGVAACGVPVEQFVFVAVEKTPPYAVAVYLVKDDDLIDAHEENEWLAAKYADCLRADKWPGYSENIEVLHLPPWHKQIII